MSKLWLAAYLLLGLTTILLPEYTFSDQQFSAREHLTTSYVLVGCTLLAAWTACGLAFLKSLAKPDTRGDGASLVKGACFVIGVLGVAAAWSRPVWSIDTNYYICYGRQILEYGLDPYQVNLYASAQDPIISQVDEFWFINPCFYGPVALSFYTLANLLAAAESLHTISCTLKFLWIPFYLGLARLLYLHWKERPNSWALVLCVLGNPLMLGFSLLDGHIDFMIATFLILTAMCLEKEKPIWAAVALSISASLKIVGIVTFPICLAWLLARSWRSAGQFCLTFAALYGGVYWSINWGEYPGVIHFANKWSTLNTACVVPGLLELFGVSDVALAVKISNLLFYSLIGVLCVLVLRGKFSRVALPMSLAMTALLFTRTYFQIWYNLWFWPLLWLAAKSDRQVTTLVGLWTALCLLSPLFGWDGRRWMLALATLLAWHTLWKSEEPSAQEAPQP